MSATVSKRILVLEDEVLVALDVTEILEQMGLAVVGPAHRVESAMSILDNHRPDAALLDVNIAGATSAEVAQRLSRDGVPFVLATGYGMQNDIAGSWAVIDKPYNRKQIEDVFASLFSADSSPRP